MANDKSKQAYLDLQEQTSEVYGTFQQEFDQKIASMAEPEGASRIQMLEQMVHQMNTQISLENLKYVGKMIESLDEDNIIESKKENS